MRRTLVMGLLLAVLSLAAGILVFRATIPSEDDIQRYSLEELAEDSPLLGMVLQEPLIRTFVEGLVDTSTERVSDRILDESRDAMALGAGTMVLVTVAGVAVIAVDHRRRHDEVPSAPPNPTGEVAAGP
jgi:hypothetical protein